jgi:hypothetical protein
MGKLARQAQRFQQPQAFGDFVLAPAGPPVQLGGAQRLSGRAQRRQQINRRAGQ